MFLYDSGFESEDRDLSFIPYFSCEYPDLSFFLICSFEIKSEKQDDEEIRNENTDRRR